MVISLWRSVFLITFVLTIFFGVSFYVNAVSWTGAPAIMHGYAWSDTVGWISFNCDNDTSCAINGGVDYSVVITNTNAELQGYAWSSNIGWIKFGGFLRTEVPYDLLSNINVQIAEDAPGLFRIYGWARACAATASGDCAGALNPDGGGWDGWISFSCSDYGSGCPSNPNYGSVVNSNGTITGYAWGSEVIGWIDLNPPFGSVTYGQPCSTAAVCTTDNTGWTQTNQWCTQIAAETCNPGFQCVDASPGCTSVTIPYTFSLDRTLVRPNSTTTVIWNVDAADADSCTVVGDNGDLWTGLVESANTSALTQQKTTYTLTCIPFGGGAPIELGSVAVDLLPTVIET